VLKSELTTSSTFGELAAFTLKTDIGDSARPSGRAFSFASRRARRLLNVMMQNEQGHGYGDRRKQGGDDGVEDPAV
jgi:hypothetical protein